MKIAFFDFDGTITRKDTMFQFIRFAKGKLRFVIGLVMLSPILISFKLGLFPNWKAKERLLTYYFKGMSEEVVLLWGQKFSEQVIPLLLRPVAIREIEFHQLSGTKMVIVTASFSIWLKHWCSLNHFELIATECDVEQGKLTGLMKGKNCYGAEKVRRIKEKYNLGEFEQIYAYGDSHADLEMLNLADIKYLKWKLIK